MSYAGEYGLPQKAQAFRVSWKPQLTPPQFQTPAVDNVSEVITYTDITQQSEHMSVDVVTGEFTVLKNLNVLTFLIAAQIARDTGGGTDQWGIFFETSVVDGVWEQAVDSTRYFTFEANADDEIRHISYSVATGAMPKGVKFRLRQISTDASDKIGLLTSKPFVEAPLSAGIIVSVQTVG